MGTDHVGFKLKEQPVKHLEEKGYEVEDHGVHEYDIPDDYSPLCLEAAEAVAAEPGSLGAVISGSGNGEQMAASRVKGVRAALVWNDSIACLAREHNNANIVSIGAHQHSVEECSALVDAFSETPFSQDEHHQRRINLMDEYEEIHRR